MNRIIRPCFAMEIQEWGRAISRKRACIVARNQRTLLLMGRDDSSLLYTSCAMKPSKDNPMPQIIKSCAKKPKSSSS